VTVFAEHHRQTVLSPRLPQAGGAVSLVPRLLPLLVSNWENGDDATGRLGCACQVKVLQIKWPNPPFNGIVLQCYSPA
jgi:hypothetical protein